MTEKKPIDQLVEDFIREERNVAPNPFLSTRIMAAIEKKGDVQLFNIPSVWKTAVVAISLAVAIFGGVAAGNLYTTNNKAKDIVVINDDRMENFGWYSQIGNE